MGSGGAELVAINSANALVKNVENKVSFIFIPSPKNFYLGELKDTVELIPLEATSLIRSTRELRKLIFEQKYDYIISHMTDENIIVSCASLGLNVKHIGYEHNHLMEIMRRGKVRWLITRLLMKITYPRLHKLIVVSDGLKNHFKAYLNKQKIVRIYNPCVSGQWSKRSHWSPNSGALNVAFVGRNVYQKNFEEALKIFKSIQSEFPFIDVKLNVYGDGYRIKGKTDSITFHGHIDRHDIYRTNNVLLMTSIYEGFGNVVIEAVEQGCYPMVRRVDFGPSEIIAITYGSVFEDVNEILNKIRVGWDIPEVDIQLFGIEHFGEELNKIVSAISCSESA